MISVTDAFSILDKTSFSFREITVPLSQALHLVLAETLYAPISMPPFRQSNMDGFALALHDDLVYEIVGEIKAGDSNDIEIKPGQAVKIFTGAAVPDTAKSVIQIEKVSVDGNRLTITEAVLPETNVRQFGAQIFEGSVALEKGTLLNPAAIGFLSGLGFTSVKVYQKPTVGIVVTGNELVQPGNLLQHGKIYESNAVMLQAALHEWHYSEVRSYQVEDDFDNTKTTLQKAIAENDVVLISGGISVGDYDFVGSALQSLGVETLFYKVNQKPGKPLFAGKTEDTMIFALPGNPAASLTCFYIHVKPTLQKLSGKDTSYTPSLLLPLSHDYVVDNSREQFLKASISNNEVTILPHQESSMLDSFALANALVYFPNGQYSKTKGDAVNVYIL